MPDQVVLVEPRVGDRPRQAVDRPRQHRPDQLLQLVAGQVRVHLQRRQVHVRRRRTRQRLLRAAHVVVQQRPAAGARPSPSASAARSTRGSATASTPRPGARPAPGRSRARRRPAARASESTSKPIGGAPHHRRVERAAAQVVHRQRRTRRHRRPQHRGEVGAPPRPARASAAACPAARPPRPRRPAPARRSDDQPAGWVRRTVVRRAGPAAGPPRPTRRQDRARPVDATGTARSPSSTDTVVDAALRVGLEPGRVQPRGPHGVRPGERAGPSGPGTPPTAAAVSRRTAGAGPPRRRRPDHRHRVRRAEVDAQHPHGRHPIVAASRPAYSGRVGHPVPVPGRARRRWRSPTAAAPPTATRTPPRRSPGRSTLGYRYVETDVHATADGVAVVFHDPTLRPAHRRAGPDRATLTLGRPGQTVRVGGAAAVPRLDEVLAAWPQVRFNIDVKADAGHRADVAAVRAHRRARPGAAGVVQRRPAGPAARPGRAGGRHLAGHARGGPAVAGLAGRPAAGAAAVGGRRAGAGPLRPGRRWSTGGSSPTPTGWVCRCTSGRSTIPTEMRRLT